MTCLIVGVALLIVFCVIETKVDEPMFRLQLFKIRAFTAGVIASLLAALSRGGLMFMLIIWLQGIWLPLHGYSFCRTPLWAGIAILPAHRRLPHRRTGVGHPVGPHGARSFATGGMLGAGRRLRALGAAARSNFSYWVFAVLLFFMGLAMASFGSPNRAGGDEQPARRAPGRRGGHEHHVHELGAGALHRHLLLPHDHRVVRLAPAQPLPRAGGSRCPAGAARRVAGLSPVSTLFAALLGYNPIHELLGPHVLATLPHAQQATLTGRGFFPSLIASPFKSGAARRL